MGRVTRSSTKAKTQKEAPKEVPAKKTTVSKKKKKPDPPKDIDLPKDSETPEVSETPKDSDAPKASDSPKDSDVPTKGETPKDSDVPTKGETPKDSDVPEASTKSTVSSEKVVTIEACKQWGAFKSRAAKIQKAIGNAAIVEINKEKPGRGNFIVTISGVDGAIVDLKGMKRPFPALKQLDMNDVIAKVLASLKQ